MEIHDEAFVESSEVICREIGAEEAYALGEGDTRSVDEMNDAVPLFAFDVFDGADEERYLQAF